MAQGKRQKKRDAGMVTVLWGLMAVLAVWAVGAGVLRLTPQGGQETEPPPPEESLQEPEAPPEPVPEPPPEPPVPSPEPLVSPLESPVSPPEFSVSPPEPPEVPGASGALSLWTVTVRSRSTEQ